MSDKDFFDPDLMQRSNATRQSPLGQARETGSGGHFDDIPVRPISDLNLTRMARHREEVNTRVAGAVKEIEHLRRRQADLERERQNLEDLSRKQADYERGRTELIERLNQSIVALEKHENQAVRLTEIYAGTRKRFGAMLKDVESIVDEKWTDENFRDELSRAGALIEEARKEYNKAMAVVEGSGGDSAVGTSATAAVLAPPTPTAGGLDKPTDLMSWFKIGFAIMLPLGILILVVGIIVLLVARLG